MNNHRTLLFSALLVLAGSQAWAQTTLSSVGLVTGVVTVTPRMGPQSSPSYNNNTVVLGSNLAGLSFDPSNPGFVAGGPTSVGFWTLSGAAIPLGGAAASFEGYAVIAATPTPSTDIAAVDALLTPNSYSGLTYAADMLDGLPLCFFTIHHNGAIDYLSRIVTPGGAVNDLKPMSWAGGPAGGPASPGLGGYFSIAYATSAPANVGNWMFYLRTAQGGSDTYAPAGHIVFGYTIPALTSGSTDLFDLNTAVGGFGATGYTTLAWCPGDATGGYAPTLFYYLRHDPATGFTILGQLDTTAGNRTISDIANLGGVYNTLVFAEPQTGIATGGGQTWGSEQMYVTGTASATAQSVSFAAIPNHAVNDLFSVYPTASSGLPITVTVVSGPATLSVVGGVVSVLCTAPGIVTLQASQAGSGSYEANELQQSFDVLGLPSITSATTAPGTVGTAFTFNVTATGSPTSYAASGLPSNLTINTATGVISGTPAATGTSIVTLTATNSQGTSIISTLTITVASGAVTPIITSPSTAPGTVGTPIPPYTISATGVPTSYTATGLPPGLTLNTSTGVITGTPTTPGTYVVTITATNSAGTSTTTVTFTVASPTVTPVITSPTTASGALGTPFVTYVIAATGIPTSYTASGLPPGLTLNVATGAINGTPTTYGTFAVTINATNSAGTSTATLNITISSSRIVNFSARAMSGPGADSLIVGFVVNGNGKNLLIRGIGPALAGLGISNFLANPILTLYNSTGAVIATDSGWSVNSAGVNDSVAMAATFASVGAFALPAGSADSALIATVNSGASTSGLLTSNNSSGVGLVEIYDIGGSPLSSLVNVSARMEVTSGNGVLIAGFVIGGNTTKTVLIRGVGPTLSTFGVTGVLADPQITVYSGSTVVATNAGWGTGTSTAAQLTAAFTLVGAFPLPTGTKDSALLLTLAPGNYTVEVTSVSNSTGVALVEVYDTQQPL
jgi:hypothetical protein